MTVTGADLGGLVTATVLPFEPGGEIDWEGYARVLDHCARPDIIRAVFVNGHAGEGAALSGEERIAVIRRTRERVGPAKPLLAGVIAFSTATAIVEARAAEAAGADVAVLFPPPALAAGGAGTDAPLAFVRAVAGSISLPVSIFQQPLRSGLGVSTATLVAMSRLPACIAVKEGSDDMAAYEANRRALREAAPHVALLPSNFDWFLAQLAIGGDGLLSGLLSLVPRHLDALWQASERLDLAAMRAASDRLEPIVRAVYAAPPRMDMHTRIKAGLRHLGLIACDHPRGPLLPLGPEADRAMSKAIAACGLTAETA